MPYAENTDVSVEKSRAELERTINRFGADQFLYGRDGNRAVVRFRAAGRHVQFLLDLPDPGDPEFTRHSRGKRTPQAAEKAWEQACRQRWRALNLAVKAKFAAIEAGISTFDDEFLAFIALPDGATVGSWLAPQIDAAYTTGQMPSMLALGAAR
jgi:hypothetical protein